MAHPFKKRTRKGGAPSVVELRVLPPPYRWSIPVEGLPPAVGSNLSVQVLTVLAHSITAGAGDSITLSNILT